MASIGARARPRARAGAGMEPLATRRVQRPVELVCSVRGCRNTGMQARVHQFPRPAHKIRAWLRALGERFDDKGLPVDTIEKLHNRIVCAKHFTPDCYGKFKLNPTAVPTLFHVEDKETADKKDTISENYMPDKEDTISNEETADNEDKDVVFTVTDNLQMCQICLSYNVRILDMAKHKLKESYTALTGIQLEREEEGMPLGACYECAALLRKFYKFRDKALKTMEVLEKIQRRSKESDPLSMDLGAIGIKPMLHCQKLEGIDIEPSIEESGDFAVEDIEEYPMHVPIKEEPPDQDDPENINSYNEVVQSFARKQGSTVVFDNVILKEQIDVNILSDNKAESYNTSEGLENIRNLQHSSIGSVMKINNDKVMSKRKDASTLVQVKRMKPDRGLRPELIDSIDSEPTLDGPQMAFFDQFFNS